MGAYGRLGISVHVPFTQIWGHTSLRPFSSLRLTSLVPSQGVLPAWPLQAEWGFAKDHYTLIYLKCSHPPDSFCLWLERWLLGLLSGDASLMDCDFRQIFFFF